MTLSRHPDQTGAVSCLLIAGTDALEATLKTALTGAGLDEVRVHRVDPASVAATGRRGTDADLCVVDGTIEDPVGAIGYLAGIAPDMPVLGLVPDAAPGLGETLRRVGATACLRVGDLAAGTVLPLVAALMSARARARDEIETIRRDLGDAMDSRERFESQSADMIAMAEDLERAYRRADSASREAATTAKRLEGVINTVVDSVLIVRDDGAVERANPAAEAMFGRPRERLTGARIETLLPGIDLRNEPDGASLRPSARAVFEWEASGAAGERFPVELSVGALEADGRRFDICVVRDIADRKRIERRIRDLALTDSLTGLSNRHAFRTRIEDAIAQSQRRKRTVALVMMDLNKFKAVNDHFGHPTGDALLIEVAKHLRGIVRKSDTVARLGGDEFALILGDLETTESVPPLLGRMIEAVCTPVVIDGSLIKVGTSLGVAFCPGDDEDAEGLIRKADLALYQAKATGENTFRLYDRELHRALKSQKAAEDELRLAIARDAFELFVQPQIDTLSGSVIGAEVLVRWRHPKRGLLLPADFLGIAETAGLAGQLDAWVFAESCRTMARWDAEGHPLERLAVNVSVKHFRDRAFVENVRRGIADAGIAPERLELEITETAIDKDVDALVAAMTALRDLGVGLAIDDFGAGYASLAYLRRFPVGRLKIDRSFARAIATREEDAAFVRAIVELAKGLRLATIVEGVETEAEARRFRDLGCGDMQGFLFAEPMSARDFPAWRAAFDARRRAAG